MPWTHFTGDLGEGDLLTRDQLGELWEALNERYFLTQGGAREVAVDLLPSWSLRSALVPVRTIATGVVSYSSYLHQLVSGVASLHTQDEDEAVPTGYSSLLGDIEGELGLPAGRLAAINTATVSQRIEFRHYWNAQRRVLGRLRNLVLTSSTLFRYSKGAIAASFGDLNTNWAAVPESGPVVPGTSFFEVRASRPGAASYSAAGQRIEIVARTLPSVAIVQGVPAWSHVIGLPGFLSDHTYYEESVSVRLLDADGLEVVEAVGGPLVADTLVLVDLGTLPDASLVTLVEATPAAYAGSLPDPGVTGGKIGTTISGGVVKCTPTYDYVDP